MRNFIFFIIFGLIGLNEAYASVAAGTKIWLEQGQKPIDMVKVGEKVKSYDLSKKAAEYEVVQKLYSRSIDDFVELTLPSGEILKATSEMPFYTAAQKFVQAQDLTPSDNLVTVHGTTRIAKIAKVKLTSRATVYNLSVAGSGNYYAGTAGILVHN